MKDRFCAVIFPVPVTADSFPHHHLHLDLSAKETLEINHMSYLSQSRTKEAEKATGEG